MPPRRRGKALAEALPYLRKTSMQLASKMRFVSAQLNALFENGAAVALANAENANRMAALLYEGVMRLAAQFPQVQVPNPADANAVFPILPPEIAEPRAAGLPLLHLGSGDRAGPLDVRVGHHRGRRGRNPSLVGVGTSRLAVKVAGCMSDLNEVGAKDNWRCWLCDKPVYPDASVNSDLGPSVDNYAPPKAKKGASVERLAHRACNTMKGKFSRLCLGLPSWWPAIRHRFSSR